MIRREQISSVLDHPVFDEEGNKIGDAKHVFLDDTTGAPEWVSVKTGFFGSNESFVPVREARVVDDHMEVPYSKSKVKDAPNVDVDSGGHLSEDEEHRLYEYYGIDWDMSWAQDDRPGEGGRTRDEGMGTGMGTDMAADTDRSGMTGGTAAGTAGAAGAAGMAGTAGTAGTAGRARADAGVRRDVGTDDDAMTRSEEQMHVGVERREAGRARLRKYVVTEEEERTVPVRHEEARIVREPITEENRDAALSGPDIAEAEHEVVLHEERPVVETEAVPVERVRLTTEELTEQETVRGPVRKERIESSADEADEELGFAEDRARDEDLGYGEGHGFDDGRGAGPGRA
ncbi:PRC and DUF2382 domain-containing protein [Streptomyces longwoodensis]|uniref:DUF2382 domain-containing protein n=1 Tax=Streptomyces longwoodensis TaxID=68231 RepID=UPI0032448C4A